MFFSDKAKQLVIERGEHDVQVASMSRSGSTLRIEEMSECAAGDAVIEKDFIGRFLSNKGGSYTQAVCGITPEQRFVRRFTLDLKKLKDEDYFKEICNTQFRIDPELNTIAVLNAYDGLVMDSSKSNLTKDVIFCGLPSILLAKIQKQILDTGIYPERLELSSVAAVGAVADYLRYTKSSKPTIVLELGATSTQSYIVSSRGVEATRPIVVGLDSMVPVVQKELGLKDEESARKLFFSNTFDFTGMGAALCKRLLKELQSSMGFFEVQTGQSISQLICTSLPSKLSWLEAVLASQIGVAVLEPDYEPWLVARGISIEGTKGLSALDARKIPLIALMMKFNHTIDDVAV